MANIVNFKNKASTLINKLSALNLQASKLYETQEYTLSELEFFLKTSIVRILNEAGSPSFQQREAVSLPVYEDYRRMVEEAAQDLTVILKDAVLLKNNITDLIIENESYRKMIQRRLNFMERNLETFEQALSTDISGKTQLSFSETFDSVRATSGKETAAVNMLSGALTLGIKRHSIESAYQVEVLPESNGQPGNAHEAHQESGEVVFAGESALHADLQALVDRKVETCFEYESFSVSNTVLEQTGSMGFDYEEGISWLSDGKNLQLKLRVILPSAVECNVLSLKPFLAKVKGTVPFLLKNATVYSTDKTVAQNVAQNLSMQKEEFLLFDVQEVKEIHLEFEQSIPYDTTIGHFYYGKTIPETNTVVRVDGPLPKAEVLGLHYSPKEQRILQPKSYDENGKAVSLDETAAKNELFSLHLVQENCAKEILPAKRYAIGLRDIGIGTQEYHESSIFQSRQYLTENAIYSVSLESDERIPSEFGVQASWIKYSISLDNGKEWLPIYPRHRSHMGASTYQINNMRTTELVDGSVKNIYKLYEPKSVLLKIELSRPADAPYKTPVIYGYNLKVKTGDEFFD